MPTGPYITIRLRRSTHARLDALRVALDWAYAHAGGVVQQRLAAERVNMADGPLTFDALIGRLLDQKETHMKRRRRCAAPGRRKGTGLQIPANSKMQQ